jgi:Mn2+/Fe2+ NRAMP family transporter
VTEAPAPRSSLLRSIAPGLLVAATGVGAGDLATAAFTGGQLGTAILWAVVVGAALKFALNEGLARWQLATGTTLLEGAVLKLGRGVGWLFLPYLLLWSLFVGGALMSACGVALHAIVPVFDDPARGKLVFGVAASAAGVVLVLAGGFRLFEKVMGLCIAVMFAVVVITAGLLWPGTGEVATGLVVPRIPDIDGQGLGWTTALLGGVGGTVTVLCYGYWIREAGRGGLGDLRLCRIDLGVGYAMTALFGLAMVIIGSTISVEGGGAGLIVALADQLEGPLGPAGRWAFLIGAFGAVFSSLLGVWQAVPYLFADVYQLTRGGGGPIDTRSRPYRAYLIALAVLPTVTLLVSFKQLQKIYAITGAAFMPLLALTLLIMNRRAWLGSARNSPLSTAVLLITLGFFVFLALR